MLYKLNFCHFGKILFSLGCTFAAHREKKSFVPAFFFFLRSISITYLITLSLEKEIIVLEEKSGKSLEHLYEL